MPVVPGLSDLPPELIEYIWEFVGKPMKCGCGQSAWFRSPCGICVCRDHFWDIYLCPQPMYADTILRYDPDGKTELTVTKYYVRGTPMPPTYPKDVKEWVNSLLSPKRKLTKRLEFH